MNKTTKTKLLKETNIPEKYSVTITCLGQKVTGIGDTVLDTLKVMNLKNVRGKTIIVVTHGKVIKERIIMPQVVMRAFNTQGITRDISLKLIASLFQGI